VPSHYATDGMRIVVYFTIHEIFVILLIMLLCGAKEVWLTLNHYNVQNYLSYLFNDLSIALLYANFSGKASKLVFIFLRI